MKIFRLNFEQEGVVLAQNVTCEQSFRMRFYIGIWYANFFFTLVDEYDTP